MNKYLPLVLIASLAACGGGGGGTTPTTPPTPPAEEPDFDPIPGLEEGESIVSANVTEINTAGGRYVLSNDSAGAVAGETAYRINVARGPKRNTVGGFGTAVEFEGANVTVYAGTDDGKQPNFAAIGDSTVNAPGANATFVGHYSVADEDFAEGFDFLTEDEESGALTLNFDLAENTVTGTSDNGVLAVDAGVDGGELDGTVTVKGDSANIVVGGFYGTSNTEVAGGFTNDDFGGYFYGK